jgi:hypothetical protein
VEALNFAEFVDAAARAIGAASDYASEMDGRAAFFLGAATWFLVEQAVRRLAGLLRWAILGAALAGGGVAAAGALDLLGGEPEAHRPSAAQPGHPAAAPPAAAQHRSN